LSVISPQGRRRAGEVVVAAAAVGLAVFAWRADAPWFERHVLVDYCATSRVGVALSPAARAAALLGALLLITVVRPWFGRWASRASAADVARIAIALVAALAVSELILRHVRVEQRTRALRREDMPRAISDPRVGWRFAPSQTRQVTIRGRSVEYAIDIDGNRSASTADHADPELPTIIVAGESIAFGESLPWSETLAARLAADLHLQVVDVGAPMYASDQSHLRVVEALARFRHPIAVITTFVPQVIRRNAQTSRPHLARHDGALSLEPAAGGLELARLWRDEPYHDGAAVGLTRAVLEETVRVARAHGATPLIVVTNYGPPCLDGDDAWLFRALFGDGEIPHVRVDLGSEDVVGDPDLHPDARGTRRLADAVEAALRGGASAR